ncbi:MAG TPA: TonB family protein, partial [Polyangiaceae bacterium]
MTSLLRLAVAFALALVALDSGAQPVPGTAAPGEPAPPEAARDEDVTLPELEHFEAAKYPVAALERRLQGEVGLILTVGSDGRVTDVEVSEPAGHGFDAAAAAAARDFVFRPATRGGVAVSAKIPYTYSFRLPEPVESPAPTAPAAELGGIEGKVEIRGGAGPLVGARVIAVSPGGAETTTTTDASGGYAFRDLPPGSYRLSFEAPGFEPFGRSTTVVSGRTATANGQLVPALEGIEIVVSGERPPRDLTKRSVERREIERIPGTGGDALRSIQSQPGVARPPGLAGLLIVRGSAPEDTQAFIDSSNVPIIYHFGGLSSVVPTELLDRIDFYPGNFGVRYGQLMGGVVDVGLATPDTRCFQDYGKPTEKHGCYHGLAEADLIDTR